jgi:hypothetical protein
MSHPQGRTKFREEPGHFLENPQGFGAWTAVDGPAVAEGLFTPWIGVRERISVYSYQLWLMLLAIYLLSMQRTTSG